MRTFGDAVGRSLVPVVIALLMLGKAWSVRAQTSANSPADTPAADPAQAAATPTAASKTRMDIYGFTMLDTGSDLGQEDPLWFDVLRPTKLPAFQHEFGQDNNWFTSVRQSRLGVKTTTPTDYGDLKTIFEFELFGVGADAGQTTFRLRHAWGELGQFGAGQFWSNFVDQDVFPNQLEYWGPNGLAWFRNVQVRWTPIKGSQELAFAAERPGASADGGQFADRIELQNVAGRFPAPDFSVHYKASGDRGHVQVAGLVRRIDWDDNLPADRFNLSGHATGWGVNVTGLYKIGKDALKLSGTYGKGIENYMNDAPIDVGVQTNASNPVTPIIGVLLPVFGMMAFYDRTWSDHWTSTAGYSRLDIDNSDGQLPSDFKSGQYALANLLYNPTPDVMVGGEFQWGQRKNNSDGWSYNDYRIQFSFRWTFAYKLNAN